MKSDGKEKEDSARAPAPNQDPPGGFPPEAQPPGGKGEGRRNDVQRAPEDQRKGATPGKKQSRA